MALFHCTLNIMISIYIVFTSLLLFLYSERSQALLKNMLPSSHHAERLIKGELILDELKDVTLLYSDLKGFTQLSAKMHPK